MNEETAEVQDELTITLSWNGKRMMEIKLLDQQLMSMISSLAGLAMRGKNETKDSPWPDDLSGFFGPQST